MTPARRGRRGSGGPLSAAASASGLTDRAVVVAGASRGIGLATARALVAAGGRVVMLARGRAELEARAGDLGDRATPIACDVADARAVGRAAAAIGRALGGVPDVLINSAGVFVPAPIDRVELDDLERTIAVNLFAPFHLVRTFLPGMRERGSGHIVNVGSLADRAALPENAAYAASKFGLRAMHQVMRAELGGSGVRATLVSPGPVDTALWDPVDPERRPGFARRSAMLDADAVAEAIVWAITRPSSVNVDELRLSRA